MASAAAAAAEWEEAERKVLVARKAAFGLPTACPTCLPVLLYLRMCNVPFDIHIDSSFPDADHIPYVEFGECVAFNNEKGGVIEYLKEEKIVDLNSKHPIGKILYWKKTREVKQQLGITKLNAAEKEEEIYQKANAAYDALSTRLGDQIFLFENSPTDVDALFLGHALFVLNVLPDTSVLRSCLQKYDNLVNFTKHLKVQLLEADSDSSATGLGSTDPSSSSTPRKRASSGRSYKPKPRAKKERTEEEKKFRRKAKYFLATQLVAVLLFLSLMGGSDSSELDDEDGVDYED
uniref:Metaxin n=1 Tax=Oryza glumipatula TaxID=40148 RepID=A0A0E0A5L2_9ORYZ